MVKCDNVFDEYINDEDDEIADTEQKPLLGFNNDADDEDNYEEMSWLYKLTPNRPCHLLIEYEFLNRIL